MKKLYISRIFINFYIILQTDSYLGIYVIICTIRDEHTCFVHFQINTSAGPSIN